MAGTLARLQDEGGPEADPTGANDPSQQPSHNEADPTDGGDPKQMIGWVPSGFPTKLRVYLKMARAALISPQGAKMLRVALGAGQGQADPNQPPPDPSQGGDPSQQGGADDHIKGLAYLVVKTMQNLENKFGPLQDQEYDKVAMVIVGWLVSSLQEMGMPGLDDAGARQDLMGRILAEVDQLTGHGQGGQNQPTPGANGPTQGAPAAPGQSPGTADGTLPQMGDM